MINDKMWDGNKINLPYHLPPFPPFHLTTSISSLITDFRLSVVWIIFIIEVEKRERFKKWDIRMRKEPYHTHINYYLRYEMRWEMVNEMVNCEMRYHLSLVHCHSSSCDPKSNKMKRKKERWERDREMWKDHLPSHINHLPSTNLSHLPSSHHLTWMMRGISPSVIAWDGSVRLNGKMKWDGKIGSAPVIPIYNLIKLRWYDYFYYYD